MLNSLVSFLLPSAGKDDSADVGLSSIGTIESEGPSGYNTPRDLEYDAASEVLQAPEAAFTLDNPTTLGRHTSTSSSFSSTSTLYQQPSMSAHSLRPLPLPLITPLSPIYEPVDLTHDENVVYIVSSPTSAPPSALRERITPITPQGTQQAFIKRSLNYAISHKSTSSLHSEACGAPKLPPLNLKPYFSPAVPNFPSSPPAQSPPSTQSYFTPLSVTSPRNPKFGFLEHPHKYSAIYEDASSERTGSFVTARSEAGPGILTRFDMPSTADVVWHTSEPMEEGEEEQDLGEGVVTAPGFDERSLSGGSEYSLESTVLDVTEERVEEVCEETRKEEDGESFVMRRWEKTMFSSTSKTEPEEFAQSKTSGSANHARQARLLFWLGFVAPWCWLIGGWMMSKKEKNKPMELESHISMKSGEVAVVCEEKEGYLDGFKKMVFPHPSYKASTSALSTFSGVTLTAKQAPVDRLDVWVLRCRIAAIVAGFVLLLGLLVTLIVLTT